MTPTSMIAGASFIGLLLLTGCGDGIDGNDTLPGPRTGKPVTSTPVPLAPGSGLAVPSSPSSGG